MILDKLQCPQILVSLIKVSLSLFCFDLLGTFFALNIAHADGRQSHANFGLSLHIPGTSVCVHGEVTSSSEIVIDSSTALSAGWVLLATKQKHYS